MLRVPTRRVLLLDVAPETREALCRAPGVRISNRSGKVEVRATADIADVVGGILQTPMLGEIEHRDVDTSRLSDELLAWQKEGAIALARGDARVLWWSAGLGKTLTYLAAAELVNAQKVLLVTRALGRNVFARDSVRLRQKRKIAVIVGEATEATSASTAQQYAVRRADKALGRLRNLGADCFASPSVQDALSKGAWAVVVGWEILSAHEASILRAGFDAVVFDEHHCGKRYNSKRTVSAHRIAKTVPIVWGGTATPVPDRVRDLWGQLYAVGGHGAWSTSLSFSIRYCHATPGRFGGWDSTGPHKYGCSYCERTTLELKRRLQWWADVRNRAAVAHMLPSVTRAMIHVPASDCDDSTGTGSFNGVEEAIARAASYKRKPIAVRAAESLIAGEKIVVVGNRRAWVPRMLAAIEKELPTGMRRDGKVWLKTATGADEVQKRLQLAADFMALRVGPDEQFRAACIVATGDSIRTSIDLHDADRVMIAALPWTPEALEQLEGRFRRIGGPRPHLKLQLDYFIAEGTIDDAIEQTLLSKLECLGSAGAEVDREARQWLHGEQPSEDDMLKNLHTWLSERAAEVERTVLEVEAAQ